MELYTGKFTNIFVILGELFALLVLFFLVMHTLRVNVKRLGQTTQFAHYNTYFEQAQNLVKWVLFVLFAICGIALAAWDIMLMMADENVWQFTVNMVTTSIPLSFWIELGVSLLWILGIILVTYFALRVVEHNLVLLQDEAKSTEFIRMDAANVEALFAKLSKILKNGIHLFALLLALRMLPLPAVIGETTAVILKVYLILAVGRLLVHFVPRHFGDARRAEQEVHSNRQPG